MVDVASLENATVFCNGTIHANGTATPLHLARGRHGVAEMCLGCSGRALFTRSGSSCRCAFCEGELDAQRQIRKGRLQDGWG